MRVIPGTHRTYRAAIEAYEPVDRAQNVFHARIPPQMIEEAKALGEAPSLRIDAVKSLQQRWQAEAQTVPLDRKHEQKLWDAFRKPIDEAFNRKSAEREKAAAAMSGRDRAVLEASKAVEEAGLQLEIKAPQPQAPSMVAALEKYLAAHVPKK